MMLAYARDVGQSDCCRILWVYVSSAVAGLAFVYHVFDCLVIQNLLFEA